MSESWFERTKTQNESSIWALIIVLVVLISSACILHEHWNEIEEDVKMVINQVPHHVNLINCGLPFLRGMARDL